LTENGQLDISDLFTAEFFTAEFWAKLYAQVSRSTISPIQNFEFNILKAKVLHATSHELDTIWPKVVEKMPKSDKNLADIGFALYYVYAEQALVSAVSASEVYFKDTLAYAIQNDKRLLNRFLDKEIKVKRILEIDMDLSENIGMLIVEKPMEITLKRCDTLIKTARKRGVRLSTVFPSRFNEVSQVIKKAVDAGRFGRLVLGDAYCKWYRSQAYYDDGGWKGTQALDGGGALMNQSIHAIDQLQWFMGPVKSVQAYSDVLGHERINVEDAAVAALEFACGAMGVIEGTTAIYPGWLKRIEINGTKGSMSMVEADLKAWEFEDEWEEDKAIRHKFASKTDSGGGAADPAAISFKPHQWQFEEFVEALEAGRPSLAADDEGRKAVEIILAIYKSVRTGKKVTLPL